MLVVVKESSAKDRCFPAWRSNTSAWFLDLHTRDSGGSHVGSSYPSHRSAFHATPPNAPVQPNPCPPPPDHRLARSTSRRERQVVVSSRQKRTICTSPSPYPQSTFADIARCQTFARHSCYPCGLGRVKIQAPPRCGCLVLDRHLVYSWKCSVGGQR